MQRPKIFMMFFYDFPSTNYQRPHKKFNFPEKITPPPPLHPRKLQPPPALAPTPYKKADYSF